MLQSGRIPIAALGREGRNRTGFEAAMHGRLSDVERSSEPQRNALRPGVAFGNMGLRGCAVSNNERRLRV